MSTRTPLRLKRSTSLGSSTVLVVVGIASWLLSRGRDGFDQGLFLGMSVAFLALAAYLIGSALRDEKKGPHDPTQGGGTVGGRGTETGDDMWLPSRDER